MPTTNLRFLILGDDRASAAFNRFAGNVDKANRAVERNRASLKAAGRDEQSFGQHLRGLSNDVLGFSSASAVASRRQNLFVRGLAAASLAAGLLEPQVASLTVAAGGLAAAATAAGIGFAAYGAAAYPAIQGVSQALQAQGKIQQATTTAQGTYQAALAAAQTRYRLSLGSATTAAQRSSAATALLNARHTALAAKVRATTAASAQYKAQLAGLSPVQRTLAMGLVGAQQAYQSWAKQFARPILMPFIRMLSLVHPLLRAFSPVVRQASAAIEILSNQLISAAQGGGLQRWLAAFTPHIAPVIISLGHIIGNLIMGTAGILRAFAPVGQGILGWIEKITAGFAKWGQSLPQHGGFQKLMEMARKDAPIIRDVLKNIAIAALNVARAMTSMATPANSRALLIALQPVAALLAQLSRNRVLVQTIAYLYLLDRVTRRLGPAFTAARLAAGGVVGVFKALSGGQVAMTGLTGVLARFSAGWRNAAAAESSATGLAGTIGGKMRDLAGGLGGAVAGIRNWTIWTKIAEGAQLVFSATIGKAALAIRAWTIWSKIAAVATKVWTAVQAVFNAVITDNPIGLIIVAVAALVAGVIYAYHRFKWFRDFVNDVGRFIAQHWQLMLAIITGGLSVAVIFIVRHWRQIQDAAGAVFRWVRDHWQILLIALTGPFGAAAVLIISHWHDIWNAGRTVINAVRTSWDTMTALLRRAWAVFVNFFLSLIGSILHGAATAFGWIPGIGSRLRTASAAFDRFRDRVNGSLRGIQGRTVKVNVDFGGGTFGGPRGSSSGGVGSGGFRARGGPVRGPGGPEDDRAGLYALSDNEYVIRARAHRKYGTRFLDAINAGKLEDGEPAYPHRQRRAPGLLAAGGQPEPGLNVRTRFPASAEINSALIGPVRYLARQWARNQMFGGLFTSAVGRAILQYASRFAGHVPYVWGGQTPSGWDCSGFVSWIYEKFRLLGSRMVSQTLQQWATPSGPVPGGMVFFGRPAYHVGFVAGRGQMLSALGRQFGTIFSSMSGNSGFGVPPRGFGQLNFSGPAGAGGGPNFWRAVGREMAARYGWTGSEWVALDRLWNRESGWRSSARNPFSGAAGIPQDITGNMHGGGRGQIAWGLGYIKNRYGDPLRAWSHEAAVGWYDKGGLLPPGVSVAVNNTGRHERVVAPGQDRPEVTVNVGPVAVTEAADVDLLARRLGFGIASAGFG